MPTATGTYTLTVQEGVDANHFSFGQTGVANQKPSAPAQLEVVGAKPRIYRDGSDVTEKKNIPVIVGQPVNLIVQVSSGTIQRVKWTVPGTRVDGVGWTGGSPTLSGAISPSYSPNFDMAVLQPFYWVDRGTSRQVIVEVTLDSGGTISSSAWFDVVGPDPNKVISSFKGTPGIEIPPVASDCPYDMTNAPACVGYGRERNGLDGYTADLASSNQGSFSGFSGSFQWVQTVSLRIAITPSPGVPPTNIACDGVDALGGTVSEYAAQDGGHDYDSPSNILPFGGSEFTRSDTFTTTLMFRPTLDPDGYRILGIFVPVAKVDWFWNYDAVLDQGAHWQLAALNQQIRRTLCQQRSTLLGRHERRPAWVRNSVNGSALDDRLKGRSS